MRAPACYYNDQELPLLSSFTCFLTTDGFDQSGCEHGFSIGSDRFTVLLLEHARKPLSEQRQVFAKTPSDFRGAYAQLDDITMLSFRLD